MTIRLHYLAAAAAIGALAAPALAQTAYPYGYQQQYQQVPQPYPGQPGYGYQQGYPNQGYAQSPVGQIIDSLLGNRYNVTDRTAVSRCASAAVRQASAQYRQPYGNAYGYNQGYNPAMTMRVTAITNVERRRNGLRVSGLIDSRGGYPPYGQAYGYQNQGYAATGDLSFRCNVDYRGAVTNLRVRRANRYRG
jgi:hypothetical protein